MIIIQLILIIAFLLLLFYFFRRQSSYQLSAWSKIFMMMIALIAIIVIIFPNSSNDLAHVVGVTRGADLLLYILTLSFLFTVLNLYMTRKSEHQRLVALARKVALLETEIKKNSES